MQQSNQPSQRNQRQPDNPLRQENPAKRLIRLQQRLSHVMAVKQVVESDGWRQVENSLRTLVKRKRVAQSSLNWEDSPEKFLAFKERSTYMAGWIQGAEYALNDVQACLMEEEGLRAEIKDAEALLKSSKNSS